MTMQPTAARATLLGQLQQRIERIETGGRADDGDVVPSGCTALDRALPSGGYRRGTIVEWFAGRSHGDGGSAGLTAGTGGGGYAADYLSLLTAKNACADGGSLVVADLRRQFHPPAAARIGIDLGNTILLRPDRNECRPVGRGDDIPDGFLWAIDQSLRCGAVAAVWAVLPKIDQRWSRRFQLSAESSGTIGIFVRHASRLRDPGWSDVQWRVARTVGCQPACDAAQAGSLRYERSPRHESTHAWKTSVELVRGRGGRSGQQVNLEINTLTGNVRETRESKIHETMSLPMAAQLARATSRSRIA